MKKTIFLVGFTTIISGCYTQQIQPLPQYDYSCYHNGKKYSGGSEITINNQNKECHFNAWVTKGYMRSLKEFNQKSNQN